MAKKNNIVCNQVFKTHDKLIRKEEFTKKWIALIYQLEQNK